MTLRKSDNNIYYGYIVLLTCFLSAFSYGIFYSLGVFFKPLQEEFRWSATLISSVQSLHLIIFTASSFIVGWSTDKIGPRWTLGWGGTLIGVGFFCCSFMNEIFHFYIFYGIASLGAAIIWILPTTTIQRWFIKGRGLTLGMVSAGVGFGTLVYAPVVSYLIEFFGWRKAYVICGMATWFILMISAFFIRKSPEAVGLKAYGSESKQDKTTYGKFDSYRKVWRDGEWTFQEALRTNSFWLICIAYFCTVLPIHMVMVHIVPYVLNLGITKAAAAGALGLTGGISIFGRITMAWSAEKFGWRLSLYICVFMCSALFIWLLCIQRLWMIYFFAVVYGFFYGGKTPLIPGLIGFMFPGKSLAFIIGSIHGLAMTGGALGPIIGGIVYDLTKSYVVAFVIGACFWAAAGLFLFLAKTPQKQKLEGSAERVRVLVKS